VNDALKCGIVFALAGVGVTIGVGEGVGAGLGVAVGVGVCDAPGVGDALGVCDAVGVGDAVGDGLGERRGVGVGVGCACRCESELARSRGSVEGKLFPPQATKTAARKIEKRSAFKTMTTRRSRPISEELSTSYSVSNSVHIPQPGLFLIFLHNGGSDKVIANLNRCENAKRAI